MRVAIRIILVALFLGVSVPGSANAAERCDEHETPEKCLDRLLTEAFQPAQRRSLAIRNTGHGTGGTRLPSLSADFESFLSVLAETGATFEDDNAVIIDLNPFVGLNTDDGYRFQAVIREAELFSPLRQALEEAGAAETISGLEKSLDDLDDFTLSFTYSPTTESLGRRFNSTATTLQKALIDSIGLRTLSDSRADQAFQDLDANDSRSMDELIETRLDVYKRALSSGHAGALTRLVGNKPQLYFSGSYRVRDDLVGPDELSLEVTYEHGFGSIPAARKCNDGACLAGAVTVKKRRRAQKEHRIAVSAKYTDIDDYEFAVPDTSVLLDLDGQKMLKGRVAYGRAVGPTAGPLGPARLDFNWEFENYDDDDPNRQDRSVATLIFSRPMAENITLTLGLTYANKPEFLQDAGDEINGHLAFKYELQPRNP